MHQPPPLRLAFVMILVGLALPLAAVLELPAGSVPGHRAVNASGWVAVAYWAIGVMLLMADVDPDSPSVAARAWWTAGCGFILLHIAVAFHAVHGWSHEAAYRHTAEVGGVGEGVYVNYLFAGVWLADVLWMWAAPTAYRDRPGWVGLGVHGFLAFVVFNATVVFGTSPLGRAVAALFFAALAWQLVIKLRGRVSSTG